MNKKAVKPYQPGEIWKARLRANNVGKSGEIARKQLRAHKLRSISGQK